MQWGVFREGRAAIGVTPLPELKHDGTQQRGTNKKGNRGNKKHLFLKNNPPRTWPILFHTEQNELLSTWFRSNLDWSALLGLVSAVVHIAFEWGRGDRLGVIVPPPHLSLEVHGRRPWLTTTIPCVEEESQKRNTLPLCYCYSPDAIEG